MSARALEDPETAGSFCPSTRYLEVPPSVSSSWEDPVARLGVPQLPAEWGRWLEGRWRCCLQPGARAEGSPSDLAISEEQQQELSHAGGSEGAQQPQAKRCKGEVRGANVQ